jgi:hypothetical protein
MLGTICVMTLPQYKPHPERNDRIESAKLAIEAIVPLELYPAHKKELLSVCLWKITEADGKMNVRYWSQDATQSPISILQHEHVHERRELIHRLLNGEAVESVVVDAVACIVTKDEHAILGKSKKLGWERYCDVGIRVFDSKNQEWIK